MECELCGASLTLTEHSSWSRCNQEGIGVTLHPDCAAAVEALTVAHARVVLRRLRNETRFRESAWVLRAEARKTIEAIDALTGRGQQ